MYSMPFQTQRILIIVRKDENVIEQRQINIKELNYFLLELMDLLTGLSELGGQNVLHSKKTKA